MSQLSLSQRSHTYDFSIAATVKHCQGSLELERYWVGKPDAIGKDMAWQADGLPSGLCLPFLFEDRKKQRIPPAIFHPLLFAQMALLAHADLLQDMGRGRVL